MNPIKLALNKPVPRRNFFCGAAVIMGLLVTLFGPAHATAEAPSINEFLSSVGWDKYRNKLYDGQIVWDGRKGQEADSAALAGSAMAIYQAPIDEILEIWEAQAGTDSAVYFPVNDESPEALQASLAGVKLTSDHSKDIRLLLDPKPTKDFNYSQDEIVSLEEFAASYRAGDTDYRNDVEAASAALQQLLIGRYQRYRDQGLDGLTPYLRKGGKQVLPAQRIDLALTVNEGLHKHFPDLLDGLKKYPEVESGSLEHELGVLQMAESGRPLFMLSHTVSEKQEDYALFFLREYYVSNTLDYLAVLTVLIEDDGYTLVGVLTQTSTDLVSGLARPVAAPIGRNILAYNLRPMFESLSKVLLERKSAK